MATAEVSVFPGRVRRGSASGADEHRTHALVVQGRDDRPPGAGGYDHEVVVLVAPLGFNGIE